MRRGAWSVLVWVGACAGAAVQEDDEGDDTDVASETDPVETDTPRDTDTDTDTMAASDSGDTGTFVAQDLYVSGSRLSVDVWEVIPGVSAYAGLFDRDLGVPCEPRPATDGVLRCLPLVADVELLYRDNQCTQPVFYVPDDACQSAPYVRLTAAGSGVCGFGERVSVLPLTATTAPAMVFDDRPTCGITQPPAAQAWYTFNPLTATPLDPADFVALSIVDQVGPAGVGTRALVGDDGARVAWGMADDGGACDVVLIGGVPRCVPSERAERSGNTMFGTSDCSGAPLGIDSRATVCAAARVVLERANRQPTVVYEATGTWSGSVYVTQPSCRPGPTDRTWVQAGAEIPAASLPELERLVEGSAQVRLRRWTDVDGRVLAVDAEAPFETPDGIPCRATPTAAGQTICLPDDAEEIFGGVAWYADDACTQPVFDMGDVTIASGFVMGEGLCTGDEGRGITSAWGFTGRHEGTLYIKAGPNCLSSIPTLPNQVWLLGTEVDPILLYPSLERVRL